MRHIFHVIPAILTWVLLALTLVAGMACYIPPSVWVLPQMLCLALPYLAAASLVVGIIWLFSRHFLLPSATAAILLVISPSLRALFPASFPPEPEPGAPVFKLLTYNIHGCDNMSDDNLPTGSQALDYVRDSGADVVCFQELNSLSASVSAGSATEDQVRGLRSIYPYALCDRVVDVSIISKYPIRRLNYGYRPTLKYFMYEIVEVKLPRRPLTIVNLHLTSFELDTDERELVQDLGRGASGIRKSASKVKRSVYSKLKDAFIMRAEAAQILASVASNIKGDLIICGDFNDVPGSYAYSTILSAGLKDAFGEAAVGPMVTFNAQHLYFHIDHVMYRGALRPFAVSRGSLKVSDHYPVTVSFELI